MRAPPAVPGGSKEANLAGWVRLAQGLPLAGMDAPRDSPDLAEVTHDAHVESSAGHLIDTGADAATRSSRSRLAPADSVLAVMTCNEVARQKAWPARSLSVAWPSRD